MSLSNPTKAQQLVESAIAIAPQGFREYAELPPVRRKRELDVLLLKDSATRMGLKVHPIGRESVRLAGGGQVVHFYQNMSSCLSVLDRRVTSNKVITKDVLRQHGIPVAEGYLVASIDEAIDAYIKIGGRVVVKPLSGSGGKGVTVGAADSIQVGRAAEHAFSLSRRIIVEECIDSVDLRIMVVGGQAVAAQMRVPANVVGDGFSTVQELIDRKNRQRQRNAYLRGGLIKADEAIQEQLAWRGISLRDVPGPGERVFIHFKANLSSGGDSVAVEGCIHPGLLRLAEAALAPFRSAYHGGVDLLVERIDVGPEQQRCIVCEINLNNEHPIHLYPAYGDPVDSAGRMLERYFSEDFRRFSERLGMAPMFFPDARKVHISGEIPYIAADIPDSQSNCQKGPSLSETIIHSGLQLDGEELRRCSKGRDYRGGFRNLVLITSDEGRKIVEPTGRSLFSSAMLKRNYLPNLLDSQGLPVCNHYRFRVGSLGKALKMFRTTSPWLVATKKGRDGEWRWRPVRTTAGLREAWKIAARTGRVQAREVSSVARVSLLMVGGVHKASVVYKPVRLIGDGASTVSSHLEAIQQRLDRQYQVASHSRKSGVTRLSLDKLGLSRDAVLESGVSVKIGGFPFPGWGSESIVLDKCPVAGLEDCADYVMNLIGSPGLASITFGVIGNSAKREGAWKIEDVNLEPNLREFAQPLPSGHTTSLGRVLVQYLDGLPGYFLAEAVESQNHSA